MASKIFIIVKYTLFLQFESVFTSFLRLVYIE